MNRNKTIAACLAAAALILASTPAMAQVAPSDLVPSISPTASPSATPTPTSTPTPSPSPSPTRSGPKPTKEPPSGGGSGTSGHHHHRSGSSTQGSGRSTARGDVGTNRGKDNLGRHKATSDQNKKGGYVNIAGGWNSDKLVNVATRLFAMGRSKTWVAAHLFRPFPLEGPASFIDSWHFPRYGPAPGEVRKHEGQDIFCNYGEPVLAVQKGVVDFGNDGLGGQVAHVTKPDGSFWYYAHLSGWNKKDFSNGDHVVSGDIIGYCGNSGDASGGSPHLHFGHYTAGGAAENPLHHLLHWLREAKQRAGVALRSSKHKQLTTTELRTMERRYGLSFEPAPVPAHQKVPDFLNPGNCSTKAKGRDAPAKTGAKTACSINPASIKSLLD